MTCPLHPAATRRKCRDRSTRSPAHLTLCVTGYMTQLVSNCNRRARDFRAVSGR